MFKINKKLEYGLMALKHMANKSSNELTTAKEICQLYRSPFDVTAKVLQQLAGEKWLYVEHGVKGGYRLQKNLHETSFLHLVEVLVGPVHVVNCMLDEDSDCSLTDSCNVIEPLKKLNTRLKDFYQTITVADLVQEVSFEKTHNTQTFVV